MTTHPQLPRQGRSGPSPDEVAARRVLPPAHELAAGGVLDQLEDGILRFAIWKPVRIDGEVVDLALQWASRQAAADMDLLPGPGSAGVLLSQAVPGSIVDGRLAAFRRVAEERSPFRMTRPLTGDGGRQRWMELAGYPTRAGGVLIVQHDATEREARDRLLTRTEARWRMLLDDAPLGIVVLSLDGYVVEANRTVAAMVGRRPEELVGHRFHDFAHPEDDIRIDHTVLLATGRASMQKRYLTLDGRTVWMRVNVTLIEEDGEQRQLSLCEDVTDAVAVADALAHRSTYDPLTGLLNRNALREQIEGALADLAAGDVAGVCVLSLDLDQFKVINDSLGHDAGDRLLDEVGRRLRRAAAGRARVARTGGDEFALLTTDVGRVQGLAADLLRALEEPVRLGTRDVTVGGSIGIASAATDSDAVALLRDADVAMYAAKSRGRGRVAVFDGALRRTAVARLDDEADLRGALRAHELRVHYQPLVALDPCGRGDSTVGHEALVRWQHPQRGLLAPAAFLGVAEETGLIVPLGREVLRLSLRVLAARRAACEDVHIAVNIGAKHLASGTLSQDVTSALEASGLPPEALVLEITEQTLVQHEHAARVLSGLRERGVRIALDDFGTGYCSLAYLRRLPVDVLKIDRTFVAGVDVDPDAAALLSAITGLGLSLGLEVVAEGVETEGELAAVREAGATHAQGYLLGRPAPVQS